MEKDIDQLKLTKRNPRILTDVRGDKLDQTMAEFGPLDGVINNVNPTIDELLGGNQRSIRFKKNKDAKVVILERYKEPTATGTVAYGYVNCDGERWPYREVFWEKAKHLAALDIANQNAGEWDNDLRREIHHELLELEDGEFFDELSFMTGDDWVLAEDGFVEHDENGPKEPGVKRWTIDELKIERDKYLDKTGLDDGGFVDYLAKR